MRCGPNKCSIITVSYTHLDVYKRQTVTGERILELLLKLHRQSGTTIIMVTHSRKVAVRADRILHLEACLLYTSRCV